MDFPDDFRDKLDNLSPRQFNDLTDYYSFGFDDTENKEKRYLRFRASWFVLHSGSESDYEELRAAITDSVKGTLHRRRRIDWQPTNEDDLEKIMGVESTLIHINFIERALHASRAVGKVNLPDNGGSGTGFVIEGNRLVTNHHVLASKGEAKDGTVWFNYQKNARGLDEKHLEIKLDPDAYFRTSKEHDLTVVGLAEPPNERWIELPIEPSVVLKKGNPVCIIQHPGGGQKQIGMYHNWVTYADDKIVQYLTDTMEGSSGSPVFNSNWDLVAIHHAGGNLRVPGSKHTLWRNEGIPVARLRALLK